ncbi:SSUH protein [Spatholobus suberectus]|nr:SSUH protein [Spatholobus suberectus]
MEEPLLSETRSGAVEEESGKWSPYVGRTGSVTQTASLAETEVSVDEIRSAAAASSGYYPPSLHGALVGSPEPDPAEQAIVYQGGYGGEYGGPTPQFQRKILDEVEIRELLIDHVGHRCCWGSRPARKWRIHAVEDCNVYVGTLDTFIEEREIIRETEPYLGGSIDGKDNGPELGIWELDLRSQFPVLFFPYKEVQEKIPHSEVIEKCSVTFSCRCVKCNGKGKIPCVTCGSRGLIKCATCNGSGSLLARNMAIIRWKTLSTRKVNATSGAASVPDEVFHRSKGVQLCNTQAYQCTPAFFADSYFLNKFSSDVIAERAQVPATARVICERHTISVVPVTRVTMAHRRQSFSFYIIEYGREVYLKDYYPARYCWGLCPCLEWLKL